MKKLDKTKVYYLGDLDNEQLLEFDKQFDTLKTPTQCKGLDLKWFDDYKNIYGFEFNYHEGKYLWGFYKYLDEYPNLTNALTLFQTNKNDRIIEIQLRMQELNNEILELDEELRKLTYEK